jgi:hypothetical protein
MSARTEKTARLLAEGMVDPDPAPATVFRVGGERGIYTVCLSAHYRHCSCPGFEHRGECSHIDACVTWMNATGEQAGEYAAALRARKAREHQQAGELFARLAQ